MVEGKLDFLRLFSQILTLVDFWELNDKWAIMIPEKLLVPFTDKGKQVSFCLPLELIPGLKTETERTGWGQWRLGLQPVQMTWIILHLAARGCQTEIMQPLLAFGFPTGNCRISHFKPF